MGVDQTSLDRIRNATFPSSRRGYDKHEVEKFLARLADWLETGGGDESRSETVKRELERVGERTGAILSQAEESAQQIRSEAEQEARETINKANAESETTRGEADSYSTQTRGEADTYAEQTRAAVEQEAAANRAQSEDEARATIADAQAQARRIVEEGSRRREDIEAVIADLVRRRDEILDDTDALSSKLTAAVTEHRPAKDADPFDKPDEFDPGKRADGGGDEEADDEGVFDAEEVEEPEAEEPESEELEAEEPESEELEAEESTEEPAEAETATKTRRAQAKGKRRRTRKVRS